MEMSACEIDSETSISVLDFIKKHPFLGYKNEEEFIIEGVRHAVLKSFHNDEVDHVSRL